MRYIALIILSVFVTLSVQAQKKEKTRYVLIMTDSGDIKIRLFNETPVHRDNFLMLVKMKYYNELLFHFIKPGSIMEGGDPNSRDAGDSVQLGDGDPGYTLEPEIVEGLYMKKGVLVASRKGDRVNPERLSNGCQFFVVQGRKYTMQELSLIERQKKDTFSDEQRKVYMTEGGIPAWDGMYTVFGEIVEGMEVFELLMRMPTRSTGRPVNDIRMWMKIVKK